MRLWTLQVAIPGLRREWVLSARPYAPDAETATRIKLSP
jgi:hypothetical protein